MTKPTVWQVVTAAAAVPTAKQVGAVAVVAARAASVKVRETNQQLGRGGQHPTQIVGSLIRGIKVTGMTIGITGDEYTAFSFGTSLSYLTPVVVPLSARYVGSVLNWWLFFRGGSGGSSGGVVAVKDSPDLWRR